jgi:hypothetical protein
MAIRRQRGDLRPRPNPRSPVALVALFLAVGCTSRPRESAGVLEPDRLHVPYAGSGKLVTLWRRGPNLGGADRFVVVTANGRSTLLPPRDAGSVRWISDRALLMDAWTPVGNRQNRIVRFDLGGTSTPLTDQSDLMGDPQPSPDRRQVVVKHYALRFGYIGWSLRDAETFDELEFYPRGNHGGGRGDVYVLVWSPDGRALAAGLKVSEAGRIVPRLVRFEMPGAVMRRLPDGTRGGRDREDGCMPIMWTKSALFAASGSYGGVLRCDPERGGCEELYHPGHGRFVQRSVVVGGGQALLMVNDAMTNFLEVNAEEIHQLDLSSGSGRLLLRAPDDWHVEDIDWIVDE